MTSESIQQLSQSNIAVDAQKVSVRLKAIWSDLSKSLRQEVLELAGITKFSVERSYKNGNISAKLVAALSQAQKINPLYLTGESDSKEGYSAAALTRYINSKSKKGRLKKTEPDKPRKKPGPKSRTNPEAKPHKSTSSAARRRKYSGSGFDTQSVNEMLSLLNGVIPELDELTEDEFVTLLRGMFLRSRYSQEADDILKMIKFLLAL